MSLGQLGLHREALSRLAGVVGFTWVASRPGWTVASHPRPRSPQIRPADRLCSRRRPFADGKVL